MTMRESSRVQRVFGPNGDDLSAVHQPNFHQRGNMLLAHQSPSEQQLQFLHRNSLQLEFLRWSTLDLWRGRAGLPTGHLVHVKVAVDFRDGDALVVAAVVGRDDEPLPTLIHSDQKLLRLLRLVHDHGAGRSVRHRHLQCSSLLALDYLINLRLSVCLSGKAGLDLLALSRRSLLNQLF